MVNLDDADVQYYNRIADQVHQFAGQHKLATYLNGVSSLKPSAPSQDEFGVPVAEERAAQINFMSDKNHGGRYTTRQSFIKHVRMYNLTQEPRRRFFLVGLSFEDIDFLAMLLPGAGELANREKIENTVLRSRTGSKDVYGPMTIATDGCMGPLPTTVKEEDPVANAMHKFIAR